jgi:hypothetical protein
MLYIHNKELLSLYHERKDRHGRVRELFVWGDRSLLPRCAGLVQKKKKEKKRERERERGRERESM